MNSISLDIKDESTDINNNGNSKISENKFDSKIQQDMKTILSMGYDEKMIRKVYTILKTSDIWADYLSSIFERLADDLKQLVWAKLVNEQYEYYKRLLEQCIECFKLNKKYLDFNLDDVDYADILSEENANNENNEC